MNRLFDTVFFDNTLRNYLYVAGFILLVLLFKKYLSRYIAGLLFRLVRIFAKGIDRSSFVAMVLAPLQSFLTILVTILALGRLNFPSALQVEIYSSSTKEILETASLIVLIVAFVWLLLRIIEFISEILQRRADLTPGHTDNQLVVFFKDFFKVLIIINGILMILKFALHINIGGLITALSIGGAAIALATRESLENLIASFIIFFDKPFTVGDLVKLQTVTGTVEKIGLRSTRIRTDQKTYVTVPNKQMVDNIMDNLSLRSQRRSVLLLELDAATSASRVTDLLQAIRNRMAELKKIESSSVYLLDIVRGSLQVQVEYFTAPIPIADFNALREEINLFVIQWMETNEVKLNGHPLDNQRS